MLFCLYWVPYIYVLHIYSILVNHTVVLQFAQKSFTTCTFAFMVLWQSNLILIGHMSFVHQLYCTVLDNNCKLFKSWKNKIMIGTWTSKREEENQESSDEKKLNVILWCSGHFTMHAFWWLHLIKIIWF